jgi:hypothetical protein
MGLLASLQRLLVRMGRITTEPRLTYNPQPAARSSEKLREDKVVIEILYLSITIRLPSTP